MLQNVVFHRSNLETDLIGYDLAPTLGCTKMGLFGKFSQHGGGSSQLPKIQNQKKVPLKHPKITEKNTNFHKIIQK